MTYLTCRYCHLFPDSDDTANESDVNKDTTVTNTEAKKVSANTEKDKTKTKKKKKKRPLPLPPVTNLDGGGQYMHFGLESALAGESPGLYFKHADLLQFAQIYITSPELLPSRIRKKVFDLLFYI